MNGLQQLNRMADQAKAIKYPNAPYRVKSKFSDKSANDLTTSIVAYVEVQGHFATRLSSTGTYRADIGKFIPSQQRAGLPDVFGIVEGHALFVEVKFGRDKLSDAQKETIAALVASGASVFIARDFQGFHDWFTALLPTLTANESLPFGPSQWKP